MSRGVRLQKKKITMDTEFCVSALERSLRLYGTPEIFKTDQGAQYTRKEFTGVILRNAHAGSCRVKIAKLSEV
jgi:putative transposase